MSDSGKSLTEAMGGFWQGANDDPAFVNLDDFMSNKLIQEVDAGNYDPNNLVLEDEN